MNAAKPTRRFALPSISMRKQWTWRVVVLLFGMLCAALQSAQAQAATYSSRATASNWIDPTAHARVTWTRGWGCSWRTYVGAPVDDDITAQLPLGFTFNFGGVNYTQVQIMSNGRLQFNNGYCGYGTDTTGPPPTYPYAYPNASVARTMRIYGVDLDATPSGGAGACPTSSCYVSYATIGTAPKRRFVVTWVNVPEWGAVSRTGKFNLQVVLEEDTQEFVYQFGTSSHPTGGSAQIGWQLTTTDYEVWSTPVVPPADSAVRFFLPAPVAEFRMDEASWTGAGSVANHTPGGTNGSPVGAAQTVPGGKICAGADIPSNFSTAAISAVDTGYDVDGEIGSSGTLSFWYKSNGAWSGGSSQSAQLFDASVANNRWFYLTRQNGNGRLSFNLTDNANNNFEVNTGNNPFAAGTWVHIGVTWKLTPAEPNNRIQIFVNGALSASSAIGTTRPLSSAIGSLYFGDNRSGFVTNPGTGNSANGVIDEVRIYNSEVSQAVILRDYAATRPCIPAFVPPSGFNAFEPATPAGATTGAIHTKVAASAFNLDIVALDSTGTAIETGFTGDVKIELVDASTAASCSDAPLIRLLDTLTFAAADQGRKTFAGISEANAWHNARIRMSYPATGPATVVACSSDNFAIRPARFGSVSVSDADSENPGTSRALNNLVATGGVIHKAGRPFRIAATAHNAANGVTTRYVGAPVASPTACLLPAAGCTLGALAAGGWSSVPGSGAVTTLDATYSEVGALRMKLVDTNFAAVDAADGSTPAEMTIESAEFGVGRFVPDHFDLVAANTPVFKTFNDTTCGTRSFTYVGQPFGYATLPQATITAKNAGGVVTVNYAGSLWKLAASGVTESYTVLTGTLDTGLIGTPGVSEAGSGSGTVTADANGLIAFTRSLPLTPFSADVNLSLSVRDSAENGEPGNGVIETATPAQFTDIAFDSGDEIRFGRLVVRNAHGSELLPLPVAIETQHWTAAGFVRNAADFCTQLAASHVALENWQRNLDLCETGAALSGRFNAGRGNLRFSAPGQNNSGSVDLVVRLDGAGGGSTCAGGATTPAVGAAQSWLRGRWSGGGYDQNPAARASFGLHRGSRAQIYVRELY